MKMTTKQIKHKLYDYCGDIIDNLHYLQIEVQYLMESEEERDKATLRAAFLNLLKIEERVNIEQMRFKKMINGDEEE